MKRVLHHVRHVQPRIKLLCFLPNSIVPSTSIMPSHFFVQFYVRLVLDNSLHSNAIQIFVGEDKETVSAVCFINYINKYSSYAKKRYPVYKTLISVDLRWKGCLPYKFKGLRTVFLNNTS